MTSEHKERADAVADAPGGALRRLARAYDIEPSYRDVEGRLATTSDVALLAILRSLGAPIDRPEEAGEALRARRHELAARLTPPAVAVWQGQPAAVPLRCMARPGDSGAEPAARLECELALEAGETREWVADAGELAWTHRPVDRSSRWVGRLPLPPDLAPGYHRLRTRGPGGEASTFVICAPLRAHELRLGDSGPACLPWGIHAPLYSVRGVGDRGIGDLPALAELIEWTGRRGGSIVGLLPVLATFADDPSPYAPASRLFWNEMLLDPGSPLRVDGDAGGVAPGDAEVVDYPAVWAQKRRALQKAADAVFEAGDADLEDLRDFERARPTAEIYARFRAACDRHGNDWGVWPARLRDGEIGESDYALADYRYHLYGQYRCARDWRNVSTGAEAHGMAIYMDLPLGAPGRSFDAWWRRELFAPGVAIGAPPDHFFESGQNWALQPLASEPCRSDGYAYLRAVLGHHMTVAGALRIDHVMGLHRQYWIPDGFDATDGVYVRSRPEELWAVMVLESQRHGCALVGEDLGTVSDSVREAMSRHAIMRTYVLQSDLPASEAASPPPPPRQSVACLSTHDMPPFASFWAADDVDLMAGLGRLEGDEAAARRERRASIRHASIAFLRAEGFLGGDEALDADSAASSASASVGPGAARAARACLRFLAASSARLVMVDPNDLWGETRQQNVPGTFDEHSNWRARSRYPVSELDGVPGLGEALEEVDALRRRAGSEVEERH